MKDVTNNFLETIEPVYTPGTINFDFEAFDKAIQAAVSELSDEQLESLEYNDIKKEITRYKGLDDKLDAKRKEISKIYKNPLTEFEGNLKKSRKQQAEAKAKAEAARLAEIEAMAKQSANEEIKAVNAETGEVIEDTKSVEEAPSKPVEPYKVNLALTFHGGENQWHQFAKLLDDNFVNYEILGENQC